MESGLWKLGATELARLIRERQVSSREAVEAHLARIRQVNPAVNAITVVLAEEALQAADAADRLTASGAHPGPLHGVPFTVKENIDLAGSATTNGIVVLKDAVSAVDAPHIAQVRAAGAIPIARTNLPDFGLRWHSDNELRGATRNPWNPGLTPGGSSGGEAAALATGMTPLGMGNDLGGSLRWPSQCCGTTAIRPTLGRVPDHSSMAPADPTAALQLMAVQGPMARHVCDLDVALACMSGPDSRDPWWAPAPLKGPEAPRRVAVTFDPAGTGVDPAIAAGINSAAAALRDAGYTVDEVDPPAVAEARELWGKLVIAEATATLLPILQQVGGKDALQFLECATEATSAAGALDFAGYMLAFSRRAGIAREWSQFHERYPLVLGPAATAQPFVVGADLKGAAEVRSILESLSLIITGNFLGLPALVLPVGVSDGLPQAVQLIGGRYREDLCLAAGQAIEERLGVFTPIEPLATPALARR